MYESYWEDYLLNKKEIDAGNPVVIPLRDESMSWIKVKALIKQQKEKDTVELSFIRSADGRKMPGIWYVKILEVLGESPDTSDIVATHF